MSEQVIFSKSTFGGFNKEEVLKYIDSLNAEHTASQEKADLEIRQLDSQLKEKNDALALGEKIFRSFPPHMKNFADIICLLRSTAGTLRTNWTL